LPRISRIFTKGWPSTRVNSWLRVLFLIDIRGFIFDLDGVLVDTAEYHFLAWKRMADQAGLPFTREDNEYLRGISRRESLMLIIKGRAASEETIQAMMRRKNDYYLDLVRGLSPGDLLPGVKDLLDELRAAGCRAAVGSASKNARDVVRRLGIAPLLDAIADGNSVERPKPAPDLFLHAAGQLGLSPGQCVVVEDAAAGIEAARAGGFRSVGLGPSWRVGRADAVCASLEAVHLADLRAALSR
jgi:beta-phosphoglucomutase